MKTIHIIEDKKEFAEEVSTYLKEFGYNVVCSDSITGLEKL